MASAGSASKNLDLEEGEISDDEHQEPVPKDFLPFSFFFFSPNKPHQPTNPNLSLTIHHAHMHALTPAFNADDFLFPPYAIQVGIRKQSNELKSAFAYTLSWTYTSES